MVCASEDQLEANAQGHSKGAGISFVPGGQRLLGGRGGPERAYHATDAHMLRRIREEGLCPGGPALKRLSSLPTAP